MTWQFLKKDGSPTQESTVLGALEKTDSETVCWVEGSEILWEADATRTLHEFAVWCAEEALKTVEDPDPRIFEAIRIKKLWLDGGVTDEELEIACDAVWPAAWHAACAAAWHAARTIAWKAACAAAWHAARTIAWKAASEAAWNATWHAKGAARDAARESQNAELERRLEALRSPPTKRRSRWDALLDEDSV